MRAPLLALVALLLAAAPLAAQMVLPSPQAITVIDSGSACVTAPTACASWAVPPATPTLTIQVTGTFSATLTFEATADGQSWFAVTATKLSSGAVASTATTTGQYALSNPGLRGLRARCTAFVSGGANLTLTRGTSATARGNDASSATGVLAAVNGGTGQSSYAIGDLLSADTTTTLSKVADPAVGQLLASGGVGVLPAYTANPTITGSYTQTLTALATTPTDGVVLANSTAATAGVPVQMSPRIRLRSNVWNTTVTATTNTNDWSLESVPVSGTTTTGLFKFGSSINGGAYTYPLTVTSAGALTALSSIISGATVAVGSGSSLAWTPDGFGSLSAPANGQFNFRNAANSAGIGLDVATDSLLKLRTRAQTANAALSAGADALASTSTDGIIVANDTPTSGGGTVQMSPRVRWRSRAWDGVSADESVDFFAEVLPVSAATPTGTWKLNYSLNGGATTIPFSVSSSGGAKVPSSGTYGWTSRAALASSADKLVTVLDNAGATGVEVNVGSATLSTCTGGTITTGSHNFAGGYTGNTSSSCIVLFGTPSWTNAPFCVAMSIASTTHPRISAVSTSQMTVTGGVSGEAITYHCVGRIGT